ncbi:DICT sensory domain-containing protein [Micromonospora sp. WMMD882]|uniref:DICT sensory domain-containing protein n=1 Tax=Micromonospora sp. WMMD882 TaxID=3015151 RepID=UPI00248B62DD|nr:DICT sensory domain-containing protein [Micromonospora sp. WMMD882]WBB80880.1 DICT sensory domain-containing protein [Micromonospora sp. WMMD882]
MLHRGRPLDRLTKQSLVTVSHAIEQAASATAEDGPLVVFALFQRMPYFERERARYERIAAVAAVTVVGAVTPTAPTVLPEPVTGVPLDESEELAREWTVVALTPRFGAALVAHDRIEVDPAATSLEAGRLFDGWWGFRRDEALHEVLRLRRTLADRLPPAVLAAVDDVVARVRDLPAAPGEARGEAALRLLADRVERAGRVVAAPRRRATGADTPVLDEAALLRWAGRGAASGSLPVALVGVRVEEPAGAPERIGRRTAARETQAVLGAVTAALRPVDRAVRLDDQEYLLVLPALTEQAAVAVAHRVTEQVAGLARSYPFVAYAVHAAVTVTARRPLPVGDLRSALRWAVREGVPVATLGEENHPPPASRLR